MIISGWDEELEHRQEFSSNSDNDLNRIFVSMRNTLREDIKDIQKIVW